MGNRSEEYNVRENAREAIASSLVIGARPRAPKSESAILWAIATGDTPRRAHVAHPHSSTTPTMATTTICSVSARVSAPSASSSSSSARRAFAPTPSSRSRGGCRVRRGRGSVVVLASARDEREKSKIGGRLGEKLGTPFADLKIGESVEKMATRYDWLSAGLGALLGCSYGVMRGQSVNQALGITMCATVVAVAIDELMRDEEKKNGDGTM